MGKHLNILMLEDSESDVGLIQRELKKQNINFTARVVETKNDFEDALKNFNPDVILSDHSMPSFNSMDALAIAKENKINCPFILVTGTVSEEFAVVCIIEGAADYILKGNLTRLPSSIIHALKTRQAEQEKENIMHQLIATNKELKILNESLEEKVIERTSEVVKQRNIIEEKNKSITDSIRYAKRIQQAKLPKKEEIYASFPQSFVLFKPKDIVSGDFYFFYKNNESVFIAAADCTGHGVPGTLMSMVGSEQLNKIISESSNPSEILNLLNKGMKTSLQQLDDSESTGDGMDIALCSVDTVTGVVKFAGANRPIWIVRKGQTEIEEIKGTKNAIGGFTEYNQKFHVNEIKLQQGDTFYLSTDGYADQFGGAEDKKLMTKKFKQLLLNIQHKTMKEQENHLENFIENWKSGAEQVDDILVIGVRL